jgi:hypothetical protein
MYELLNTGRVRSILLDGKRLVDLDSIENLDVVAATPPAPAGTVVMKRGGPGRRPAGRLRNGVAPTPHDAGCYLAGSSVTKE